MGHPSINLKEAGESIESLCSHPRGHSSFSLLQGDPSRQVDRTQHNHYVPKSVCAKTGSPLCHSQDKFLTFIYLHLLSLSARSGNPCLPSPFMKAYKKILGCCHSTHSVLHLPEHWVWCERWLQEVWNMRQRPMALPPPTAIEFLAPLPSYMHWFISLGSDQLYETLHCYCCLVAKPYQTLLGTHGL